MTAHLYPIEIDSDNETITNLPPELNTGISRISEEIAKFRRAELLNNPNVELLTAFDLTQTTYRLTAAIALMYKYTYNHGEYGDLVQRTIIQLIDELGFAHVAHWELTEPVHGQPNPSIDFDAFNINISNKYFEDEFWDFKNKHGYNAFIYE